MEQLLFRSVRFSHCSDVFDHLINFIVGELIPKGRHVVVAIVHDLVEFNVGLLLRLFRAKIGGLQLFPQSGVAAAVSAMAEHALGFEDAFAALGLGRQGKCCEKQQGKQ